MFLYPNLLNINSSKPHIRARTKSDMLEKYAKQLCLAAIVLILLLLLCHLSNATNTNYLSWLEEFTATTTTNPSYCPGAHPKIPCSMVKQCPTPSSNISSADQEIIDRYIYLKSLLESTKLLDYAEQKWEVI